MKLPSLKLPSLKPTPKKQAPLTGLQKLGITRRPKKRELTQRQTLLICGAVLLILIPVFAVGIISERRAAAEAAAAAAATAAQQPPVASKPAATEPPPAAETTSAETSSPPAAEPSETQEEEEARQYDENHLQFGSTGRYIHGYGRPYPEVLLKFSVSAPTSFKPSKRAKFEDVYSFPYGGEESRQPANVYFTVTVKNMSKDESYDISVQSSVDDSGDDEEQSYIEDGDIGRVWKLDRDGDLRPGKSVTVKDGWSLKSADNVEYELRFDGVGGESFYFTK